MTTPLDNDELEVQLQDGHTIVVTVSHKGTCRSCGEEILWCMTEKGKYMPVDAPEAPDEKTISHFATCADAEHWRKRL